MAISLPALIDVIFHARAHGKGTIDLTGCYYGETVPGGDVVTEPYRYYYFLAGLVALLRCQRIVELGTHYGGSAFSMYRGVQSVGLEENLEFTTVDRLQHTPDRFAAYPRLTRVHGNCLDPAVIEVVEKTVSGPLDLLYLDSEHSYEHTQHCLSEYAERFSPAIVLLDDIRFNPSMCKLWDDLCSTYRERALDCSETSRRGFEPGLGLLLLREQ